MAKKAAKQKASPSIGNAKAKRTTNWAGSIHQKQGRNLVVPGDFAALVRALEKELQCRVWMLLQPFHEKNKTDRISEELVDAVIESQPTLPANDKIAVLLNSPGGQARPAYRLARLFQNSCGKFAVVVPRVAKSAATLFALGANEILMGDNGELGAIDVQLADPEREDWLSALDETQALEALQNAALQTFDTFMALLRGRTHKKTQTLMEPVLHFSAEITKPLFEKLDSIRLSQMSRALKVGEQYAFRLLKRNYTEHHAEEIASHLVSRYPEHGFFIDREEAAHEVRLRVPEPSGTTRRILSQMYPFLAAFAMEKPEGINAVGFLERG